MKTSKDLIHTPKTDQDEKCLSCGHSCHCGDACSDKACICGRCVHDPAELTEE